MQKLESAGIMVMKGSCIGRQMRRTLDIGEFRAFVLVNE